jgi:uncharacterized protein (TIGR03435 family)
MAFAGTAIIGLRVQASGDIPTLMKQLQTHVERPLVDETGLEGEFTWDVTFSPFPKTERFPPLVTAVSEQLHLRLVPTEAEVDVVVIDAVSMPTPN